MAQYKYLQGDGTVILAWWESLTDHQEERALLRRARGAGEVMLSRPFFHFLNFPGISAFWAREENLMVSAVVVGVLSGVKEHNPQYSFAQSLAKSLEKGGRNPVSELRFFTLQKSCNIDEFFSRISRIVSMLKGRGNVLSLANDIVHWERELRLGVDMKPMNRLAVKWANDYFSQLPKS